MWSNFACLLGPFLLAQSQNEATQQLFLLFCQQTYQTFSDWTVSNPSFTATVFASMQQGFHALIAITILFNRNKYFNINKLIFFYLKTRRCKYYTMHDHLHNVMIQYCSYLRYVSSQQQLSPINVQTLFAWFCCHNTYSFSNRVH